MSNVDEATEVVRKQVAKHQMLNASGEVTEDEREARGIRYTQVSTGKVFDYMVTKEAVMMLAVFGSKTLATNEASQVRNNPKGGGSDAEQMEAIEARFKLLDTGEWIDRTREGPSINYDAAAEAVVRIMLADNAIQQDQVGDFKDKIRRKVEEDATYLRTVRQHPKFPGEYAQIVGRQTKTTADLLAGVAS